MNFKLASRLLFGFVAALLLLGANGWIAHNSVQALIQSQRWVTHTYEILREVETDVSLAKDVETGTRGYVIGQQKAFLEPYNAAKEKVQNKLEPLYSMTRDDAAQQKRVLELADLIDVKLANSRTVIDLVDAGKRDEAIQFISSGEGKTAMDAVRAKASEMRRAEEDLLRERQNALAQTVFRAKLTVWLGTAFSFLLLGLVYLGLTRARLQREKLEVALADLKRSEAMRDSLNAMLVHDLRTPLTTMLAPLEMLQNEDFGELEETQREIVGMSLGSSRRLLGLVNELLDISKMEAGELQIEREAVRPDSVVDEAINQVALAEYDGAARVERDVPAELPTISANGDLLARVLVNLLGNAVKFTPRQGTITVSARGCVPSEVVPARVQASLDGQDVGAPSVLFGVRDTGEGIPAADLDRIFEKFGQVESRQSGRKNSTGLGLTFCKLAVEAHGGIIWVESEVGQGSTFYFTIPVGLVGAEAEGEAVEMAK